MKFLSSCAILFFASAFAFSALAEDNHFIRAQKNYDQGLYSEAVNFLEKELDQNPKNVSAWKLLGKCYLEISKFDKAIVAYEQARNLDPNNQEIISLLDQANWVKREKLESNIQKYQNYLIRHPDDAEYRLKLARMYKDCGDYKAAQREYEIYLANNPYEDKVKEEYYSIAPEQSHKKFSKRETRTGKVKSKKYHPLPSPPKKDWEKILDKARDLVGQEKYVSAESLYENYLKQKPSDTVVLKEYAQMLSWNKQYEKSIAVYRKLLELKPNDKNSAFELAQVLSWAGKYDEAITQYQTLDTTNIEVLIGLAQTYYWKGDYRNARLTYQKILALDPKNLEAKKMVSELQQREIPAPELRAKVSNFWDSEEFYYKNFAAALNIHLSENTSLEPGFSARQFEQRDDVITGYSYSIRLMEKFSETVDGDIHYAYNYYDCVPNTQAYGLALNYYPYLLTNFSFSYDHHDIIYDVSTTRSLIQAITTDNFEVSGSHQFEKGYGIIGSYLYGMYSDDNRLQNPQARLYYQLFKILRIGYAYNMITYSFASPWYWSPDFYQTHSIWFELANGSKSPLSYYVSAEIAKVTNSSKLARSIFADFALNPSQRFSIGFQFSYSELSRTKDAPAYWQQSLAAYLKLQL
ncbi:MAG: tetratricopeptide repeat protein [candidate division WOR-3 bacterium]|nr:tetratricopeptide repeat protein [candidate division WOR-3 bacterium]